MTRERAGELPDAGGMRSSAADAPKIGLPDSLPASRAPGVPTPLAPPGQHGGREMATAPSGGPPATRPAVSGAPVPTERRAASRSEAAVPASSIGSVPGIDTTTLLPPSAATGDAAANAAEPASHETPVAPAAATDIETTTTEGPEMTPDPTPEPPTSPSTANRAPMSDAEKKRRAKARAKLQREREKGKGRAPKGAPEPAASAGPDEVATEPKRKRIFGLGGKTVPTTPEPPVTTASTSSQSSAAVPPPPPPTGEASLAVPPPPAPTAPAPAAPAAAAGNTPPPPPPPSLAAAPSSAPTSLPPVVSPEATLPAPVDMREASPPPPSIPAPAPAEDASAHEVEVVEEQPPAVVPDPPLGDLEERPAAAAMDPGVLDDAPDAFELPELPTVPDPVTPASAPAAEQLAAQDGVAEAGDIDRVAAAAAPTAIGATGWNGRGGFESADAATWELGQLPPLSAARSESDGSTSIDVDGWSAAFGAPQIASTADDAAPPTAAAPAAAVEEPQTPGQVAAAPAAVPEFAPTPQRTSRMASNTSVQQVRERIAARRADLDAIAEQLAQLGH